MPIFSPALQERQAIACRLLCAALSRRALSNAYLLSGRSGADKWLIAQQLAAFLNCTSRGSEDDSSCLSRVSAKYPDLERQPEKSALESAGLCQNCLWIGQKEHPQALIPLSGEGASGKLPVEKVRVLSEELNKTSRYMRIVVIPEAGQDCLHAAPANALLKNIEEAQKNTLFLLFAHTAEQVLPTIISRCQVIPIIGKFQRGLCFDESLEPDEKSKLEQRAILLKSELIHTFRRSQGALPGHSLKAYIDSQDLSKRLLELSDEEGFEVELLLDIVLSAELELLKENSSRSAVSYLSELAGLCETAKAQLSHYVRKNNVLETFSYSLTELRMKYLGDFHLAKN